MILKIEEKINLTRYDIEKPPNEWNSESHSKNTEYSNIKDKGPKNKESFYFLFDNKETTDVVAQIACKKMSVDNYWLTSTNTTSDITIIDFSNCKCLHDMLDILDSLKINIYDSDMIINGFEDKSIEELKSHDRLTRIIPSNLPELLEVSWFGQLLTDYDNGKIFKKLIDSINLKIDGYRWCENLNPYSLTYCFFYSTKIESPSKRNVRIQ